MRCPGGFLLLLQRLPEFEAIALWIGDPGEAAIGVVFAVRVDGDAGGSKLDEESVEIIDTVVDHCGLSAGAEVGGVSGEEGPDSASGGWGDLVGPEKGGSAVVREL